MDAPSPFAPYGSSHWAVLALFVAGVIAAIRWGRAVRRTAAERHVSRTLALSILLFQVPAQLYAMLPPNWDLGRSLPFQLCDLAWMVAVYALWCRRQWATGLLYYWGLTLTSQALITPQLEWDFPHLQFIMFWGGHCLVVWAAVWATWGLGIRPGWPDYLRASTVTVGWGLLMLGFNAVAGTNYLYVSRKPPGASLLDLFGEWPAYLLVEAAFGLTLWVAITLPWTGLPGRLRRSGTDR